MKTLLFNFDRVVSSNSIINYDKVIAGESISNSIKILEAKCIIGSDFKRISELEKEYDNVVILLDERNLNFAALIDILSADKDYNKKFHVIIDATFFDEETEETVDDIVSMIFDVVDGIIVADPPDLGKYVDNYLKVLAKLY